MPQIPNTDLTLTEAETKNDYKDSDEYKKCFNKNGKNITIDPDDCSILTKEMLQEKN